eukprot:TRINITY_DN10608_c0_g1_i1.p1 TRINITY_DN10608_c0_g1~~TRINITY_DN10608_c0_g1_i1.p1  ORF type:complete len:211 (-),score=37.56 TRINITY_DN10608_c0_g1_i1:103-735(-)
MSHHCHDEHHDHGGHDHKHDEIERGDQFSLFQHIDISRVTCLNENEPGSCRLVFKPWDIRLDRSQFLESSDDAELLLHIPFAGSVKLKSFIIGGAGESAPSRVKMFTNRDDIDFSNASDVPPVQEWELQPDPQCELEYPTKIVKFSSVSSLTMYIPANFGAERTRITYIGLKGDFSLAGKREAVIAAYEAKPLPGDHKTGANSTFFRSVQ